MATNSSIFINEAGPGFCFSNNLGRIAFLGNSRQLPTPGGPRTFTESKIWAQGPSGDLRLVVRVGDVLEVAPGDFRTIGIPQGLPIPPDGGLSFSRNGFNDRHQIAFRARFKDGSQGITRVACR